MVIYGDPQHDGRLKRGGCQVKGCSLPHEARGYCREHYTQFRCYGDPLVRKVAKRGTPIAERILGRAIRATNGCLVWQGGQFGNGYGQIGQTWTRRKVQAHRALFAAVNGPIPPGMVVMHTCDTPLCVEITHLRLGTLSDNTQDMIAKGRGSNQFGSYRGRVSK